MASIFVTGSAQGLGHAIAETLLAGGHEVVAHVRDDERLPAVDDLVARGARVVMGDLGDIAQTRNVAEQVNRIGSMDVVVHNAAVLDGPAVLPVNVVAPYVLTALIERPQRLIYVSSGMHRGGKVRQGLDWSGGRETASYSDSKFYLTALSMAVARRFPDSYVNAVDPGWVPTRMGGPGAPDDFDDGHRTQEWLAVSDDPRALTSGGFWYHLRPGPVHPGVRDRELQDWLLQALSQHTGLTLD